MHECPVHALELLQSVLSALCAVVRAGQPRRGRKNDVCLDDKVVAGGVDRQMLDPLDQRREPREEVRHALQVVSTLRPSSRLDAPGALLAPLAFP